MLPMAVASQILPALWLGKITDVQSDEFLESHNIAIVLCLCDCSLNQINHVQQIVVPVDDCASPNTKETEHFKNIILKCIQVIKPSIDSYQSVLVACGAGRQRSAAIVATYLALYRFADRDNPLEDAITHVMTKRATAFRTLDKGSVIQKTHWMEAMQLALVSTSVRQATHP